MAAAAAAWRQCGIDGGSGSAARWRRAASRWRWQRIGRDSNTAAACWLQHSGGKQCGGGVGRLATAVAGRQQRVGSAAAVAVAAGAACQWLPAWWWQFGRSFRNVRIPMNVVIMTYICANLLQIANICYFQYRGGPLLLGNHKICDLLQDFKP